MMSHQQEARGTNLYPRFSSIYFATTGKNGDDCRVSVRKLQLCLFWDGDCRLI